jgi:acetyl esterase/lipase
VPKICFQVFAAVAFALSLVLGPSPTRAEQPRGIPLWPAGAPDAKGTSDDDQPTLTISLPPADKATGAAVIVCPGGGYRGLAFGYEGVDVGKWLNDHGVAAFVLKYRHRGTGYGHPTPLGDAQRAIRLVRHRASQYGVDPHKIGILGFSAGGHLASSAGTHFDAGNPQAKDPIDTESCRPDFLILCYPVISFTTEYVHAGSRKNLLGEDPDPKLVESYSNELQVTKDTPPTFLWHTDGDTGVVPENSVLFYLALRKAKVPAELHIYEHGRHGLGLAAGDIGAESWPDQCIAWMRGRGLLDNASTKAANDK